MKRFTLIALVLLAGCGAYERQKAQESRDAEDAAKGLVTTRGVFSVITLPDGSRCATNRFYGGIDCDWKETP